MCVHVQLVPTLCNPMDCGLPGSSVHGIFQARILEWVAIFYSRGIFLSQGSKPESPALADRFITTVPPEKNIARKIKYISVQFSSVTQSCLTLRPHELQHARLPCPSSTPGVHPNSCASSRWCHPAISSSVIPFFSCPQSLPASESFPMSQLFAWGGQSIGVSASASVLPMNTQDWSLL